MDNHCLLKLWFSLTLVFGKFNLCWFLGHSFEPLWHLLYKRDLFHDIQGYLPQEHKPLTTRKQAKNKYKWIWKKLGNLPSSRPDNRAAWGRKYFGNFGMKFGQKYTFGSPSLSSAACWIGGQMVLSPNYSPRDAITIMSFL